MNPEERARKNLPKLRQRFYRSVAFSRAVPFGLLEILALGSTRAHGVGQTTLRHYVAQAAMGDVAPTHPGCKKDVVQLRIGSLVARIRSDP